MTLGDLVRRILGLDASPGRIARRTQELAASATTAGTARRIQDVLQNTCPMDHPLTGHRYAVLASAPLPTTEDATRALLDAVQREDWSHVTIAFGFAAGKSLDVIALRCPDETMHAIVVVSAHDPYDADHTLEHRRVNDPQKLLAHIQGWDSFDQPRPLRAPDAQV